MSESKLFNFMFNLFMVSREEVESRSRVDMVRETERHFSSQSETLFWREETSFFRESVSKTGEKGWGWGDDDGRVCVGGVRIKR